MGVLRVIHKIVILLTILLVTFGCSVDSISTTAAFITVIEKDHSSDYKEAWIIARNDVDDGKKEDIRIDIEETMVWNLIESGREYFVSFTTEGNNKSTLIQINYIGDKDSLR